MKHYCHRSLICLLLLLAPLLCLTTIEANAQQEYPSEPEITDLGRLPESFDMALDTLFNNRYREYYNLSKHPKPVTPADLSRDKTYRQRVQSMESEITLAYNPIVRDAIDMYVNRKSSTISLMLTKSAYYFPIIEDALDRYGLPLELKYLAIVESALNPTAVSRMGATGLWQFMLRTGKVYGLHIDSLIDERRDPWKSSEAMCKYFKDMYALYGDWLLSIAAYNCGPGNVNKAIRRAGGSKDFWVIYPYLPRETRSYVPFFIAAFYAMEHYDEHDIRPRVIQMPLAVDTIHIHTKQSFETLSTLTGVNINTIRELNPQYRRDIVPGNNGVQTLVLPASDAIFFSAHRDSILQAHAPIMMETITKTIQHQVQRGENLAKIAQMYGVNIEDIKQWNRLRHNTVRRGQILKIELLEVEMQEQAKSEEAMQESIESTTTKKVEASKQQKVTQKENTKAKAKPKHYYTVKKGDTLSSIAAKYKGVTVTQIKRANGLRNNMIRVGQKLVIPE